MSNETYRKRKCLSVPYSHQKNISDKNDTLCRMTPGLCQNNTICIRTVYHSIVDKINQTKFVDPTVPQLNVLPFY